MNWTAITEESQLAEITEVSKTQPVLIFKHSTRCPISSSALMRIQNGWKEEKAQNTKPYILDLINHRNISMAIAEQFNVEHESPQVLLIKDGKSVYNESHYGISFEDLETAL